MSRMSGSEHEDELAEFRETEEVEVGKTNAQRREDYWLTNSDSIRLVGCYVMNVKTGATPNNLAQNVSFRKVTVCHLPLYTLSRK